MRCDICGRINGHLHSCPLETNDKKFLRCSYCEDEIADGEDYVEINGEYYHKDCLSIDLLLDLIDVQIKEMTLSNQSD